MIESATNRNRFDRFVNGAGILFAVAVLVASLARGKGLFPPCAQRYPWLAAAVVLLALLFGWAPRALRLRLAVRRVLFESASTPFRWSLFAVATVAYAAVAFFTFHGVPRLDDGISAVFQGRIFLQGRLVLPPPAHSEFFRQFCMLGPVTGTPHLCAMYPPTWPVLLVPGILLGVPWLVNPVLGGLLALAVLALGRELFDETTGRVAGILTACSPFVSVLAGTHLSHIATALMLTVCFWSVVRLLKSGRSLYGVIAGGAWAVAFLSRPLTALVVGVVIALGPLAQWKRSLQAWRGVLLAGLLAVAGAGTLASWQYVTTGDARTPGHEVGLGRRGKYGFVRLDWARTHTPRLGAIHTLGRMRAVNDKLLGWPVPALIVVLLPFLRRRARATEWWLAAPWLGLLAAYSAFWYWEEYFPGRYTFCAMPMLLVLAGRGCTQLDRPASGNTAIAGRSPGPLALALLTGGCVYALLIGRPHELRRFTDHHGDVESILPRAMEAYAVSNSVVFLDAKGSEPELGDTRNDYYGTGFMRNQLDFQGDLVFARYLRGRNRVLMDAYPGRRYFHYVYVRGANTAVLYEMFPDGEGVREAFVGHYPAAAP
jgi:hypothetical protein